MHASSASRARRSASDPDYRWLLRQHVAENFEAKQFECFQPFLEFARAKAAT